MKAQRTQAQPEHKFEVRVVSREKAMGWRHTGQYMNADGKLVSAGTFPDRDRARDAARDAGRLYYQDYFENRIDKKGAETPFGRYFDEYYVPTRLATSSKSNQDFEHSYFNTWIRPHLGNVPVGSILPMHVEGWSAFVKNGRQVTLRSKRNPKPVVVTRYLKPVSQRKAHAILFKVLQHAIDNRFLGGDHPCQLTTSSRGRRKTTVSHFAKADPVKVLAMSNDEFEQFLAKVDPVSRALVLVAIGTGLRQSELIALKPREIEWHHQPPRIKVYEAEVVVSKVRHGVGVETKRPKNDEARYVPIDAATVQILSELCSRYGMTPDSDQRFFRDRYGRPVKKDALRYHVKRAMRAAGLGDSGYTFKTLRATYATWMLQDRGPEGLVDVSELLGHKSLSTTQRYLAEDHDAEAKAVEALELRAQKRAEARARIEAEQEATIHHLGETG